MRHIAKRIVAVVLAMMMVLSLVSWASAADYADMPTNWAKEPMEAAVENGLLQGNNGLLNPNGNLTRAQMAAIVVRAFGMNYYDDLADFTDVKDTDWFVKDNTLGAAYIMGLFQGNGDGRLTPNTPITREAAFAVLARALKLEAGTADDLSKFSDAGEVSSWFVGEVAAMAKAGYVNGNDGKLNPKGNITRAQFAQVMFNIFGDYVKEEGTVTEIGGKSVVISADGVTLKGVNVKGDVIIGEGVAEGDVYLDNVKIDGRLIVRGGGINSVHIIGGSSVANIIVAKVMTDVRIVTEGEATSVGTITVVQANSNEEIKDGNVIIEGAAEAVVANSTSTIKLANAKVETVEINAKTEITADNSEIGKATVAAEEAYLTLTNGSSADEVVVTEAAKDAVVNVDAGTTIGKLETSADMTLAGAGTVEEEIANGDVEIKKEAEVVERPEEEGSTSRPHTHTTESTWEMFDSNTHKQVCSECGETVYEAHDLEASKWSVVKIKTAAVGETPAVTETAEVTDEPDVKGDAAANVGDIISAKEIEWSCSVDNCTYKETAPAEAITEGTEDSDHVKCTGEHEWVAMSGTDFETYSVSNQTLGCEQEGVVWYKCTNTNDGKACPSSMSVTTAATGHSYRNYQTTTQPTCGDDGVKTWTCTNAGCCVTEHNHTAANHEATPATATEAIPATGNHPGYAWVSVDSSNHQEQCTTCNAPKKDAAGSAIAAVAHDTVGIKTIKMWASAEDKEAGDATKKVAKEVKCCSVCGYTATTEDDVYDEATMKHTCLTTSAAAAAANIKVAAEAHGEGAGATVHSFTCTCGEKVYVDEAHDYTGVDANSNPTGKCTVCSTAHVHAAGTNYTYTAGDGENGATVDQHIRSCSVCHVKFAPEDHNWTNGTCTVCSANHTCGDANAANAAKFTFAAATEKGKHIATCKTCGKATDAATCDDTRKDDGKCDLCNQVLVTKTDHTESHGDYLTGTVTKSATEGKHNVMCVICKVNVEVSCSANAEGDTSKCSKCGDFVNGATARAECEEGGHNGTVTWTASTTGTHTGICSKCGAVSGDCEYEYTKGAEAQAGVTHTATCKACHGVSATDTTCTHPGDAACPKCEADKPAA